MAVLHFGCGCGLCGQVPLLMAPASWLGSFFFQLVEPEMDLGTLVKKYLELGGGYGRSVHLSELGLPKAETERLISGFDEDYQISRYMLLSRERNEMLEAYPAEARIYRINDFEVSHVSFEAGIEKLL